MRKIFFRLKLLIFFSVPFTAFSQDNIGDLFKSGPADATKLANAYMDPLFKGLGVGLNSGWTNTAKTKKPFRFDLRFTVTAAFVPASDKAYDVNTLGLENIRAVDKYKSVGPTAFGPNVDGPMMEIYNSSLPDPNPATFKLPSGLGINFVPSPQLQLTLGLLKHTDLSLRWIPKVEIEDGKLNLFGIGAKIELLPFLMGKSARVMPVDLALAVGYTSLYYNFPLKLNNQSTSGQVVDVKLHGISAEVIASKKLAIFTAFASIGYHSSTSDLKALGSYEFDVPKNPSNKDGKQIYVDPVSLKQTDVDGLKAALGFQFNLAFFSIFASYTQSNYSYVNTGIGFALGK